MDGAITGGGGGRHGDHLPRLAFGGGDRWGRGGRIGGRKWEVVIRDGKLGFEGRWWEVVVWESNGDGVAKVGREVGVDGIGSGGEGCKG